MVFALDVFNAWKPLLTFWLSFQMENSGVVHMLKNNKTEGMSYLQVAVDTFRECLTNEIFDS